ncbi:MAG: hypothetical protein ACI97A_003200 [Planctomycetota bacterium]
MFTDSEEVHHCTDGVALIQGLFGGVVIDALVVNKSSIAGDKIGDPNADLNQRLGDTWDSTLPTVLLVKGQVPLDLFTGYEVDVKVSHDQPDAWQTCAFPSDASRAKTLLSTLSDLDFLSVGGDPTSEHYLVLSEAPIGQRPPVRVLHHLPGTHVGGLNPFFSAIGAEPFAIMDSIDPLLEKLEQKGTDCIAVLSRAGAFLWTMDLKGRIGMETTSCVRVDEDVVLPLTASLEPGAHVELSMDLQGLLPRARSGDLDVSFIMNPPSAENLRAFGDAEIPPAHVFQFPAPFALSIAK